MCGGSSSVHWALRARALAPQVRGMCLYSATAAKTLRLEEFDQAQAAAAAAAANHLRDNWLASVKHIIK